MKQDENQDCFERRYVPRPCWLCLGKVDSVKRGLKETKSQTRTILETINTLYSISYDLYSKNDQELIPFKV